MQPNSNSQSNRRDLTGRVAHLIDRAIRPSGSPAIPHPAQIRRIVVIKPCCLGDMLMATPAIRALNMHFPSAEITVVTDEWTRMGIETNPRIDRLILYPESGGARAAAQLAWRMRPFQFDLGVCLDRSPIPALALWLARIPFRAGLNSQSRGIGLTHRIQPEPGNHETSIYLDAIETLGVSERDESPEFHVPDQAIEATNQLIPGRDSGRLVIIHPGGAVNPGVAMLEKRWPATNFGELASLLVREAGATVALVGSESDRSAVETVRDFARAPVVDLCGQLSLTELAALCKRASLFVGNDSGVTHLASAVGTPVVAIFGPTSPNRYRPLGRRTVVCATDASWKLQESPDLRRIDRQTLPDIADVPLPQVFNAALDLLGGSA